jgi:hypothetical protein
MVRIEAEPNGAAETAPWPALTRWRAGRLRRVVGHERCQMGLEADRAHARSAAAVRDGEGLVQVHVADVGADKAGRGQADLGVEVGAVHVHLAAVGMDDGADVANRFLEHAVRRRVGDHQAGQVVLVLFGLGLEVATSTLPLSSQSTTTTFMLAIWAVAGLVPCADLGIRQTLRCSSPRLAW